MFSKRGGGGGGACLFVCNSSMSTTDNTKGQLISKSDWRAIDSPKKQTDEFVLFAFSLFKANKPNFSVRFLGESTAC